MSFSQQHHDAWRAAASETLWHHLCHQPGPPQRNRPPVHQEAVWCHEAVRRVWGWRRIKPQVRNTWNLHQWRNDKDPPVMIRLLVRSDPALQKYVPVLTDEVLMLVLSTGFITSLNKSQGGGSSSVQRICSHTFTTQTLPWYKNQLEVLESLENTWMLKCFQGLESA